MSHFSVIVIGDDVDAQLQPYHEYECTGIDDEYVVEVDETDKLRADYAKYGEDYKSFEEFASNWFGPTRNDNGRYLRRTNPNAKWDWWTIGGRWSDWLPHTQAKRKDFDLDQIRTDAGLAAMAEYRQHCPKVDPPDVGWDEWRDRAPSIDVARETWNAHPFNVALRESGYYFDTEQFMVAEAEFVANAVRRAVVPFALVAEGAWGAKGDMGWFGMSSNEREGTSWEDFVNTMLDELDGEVLLTVVDCHI